MNDNMAKIKDCLIHWKKKLERNIDEEIIVLDVIRKLYKVPITVELLHETRIGRIIKQLSKRDGKIGEKATIVLKKWKDVVSNSQTDSLETKTVSKDKKNRSKTEKHNDSNNCKLTNISSDATYQETHAHLRYKSSNPDKPFKMKKLYEILQTSGGRNFAGGGAKFASNFHAQQFSLSSNKKNSENGDNCKTSNKYSNVNGPNIASSKYLNFTDENFVVDRYNPDYPEFDPVKRKYCDSDECNPNSLAQTSKKQKSMAHDVDFSSVKSSPKQAEPKKLQNDCNIIKKTQVKQSSQTLQQPSTSTNGHSFSHDNVLNFDKKKSEKNSLKHKTSATAVVCSKTNNSTAKHSATKCKEKTSTTKIKSDKKLKIAEKEEFTSSEARFEDCLGFNDIVTVKKKKMGTNASAKDNPLPKHKKKEKSQSEIKVKKEVKSPDFASEHIQHTHAAFVPKVKRKVHSPDFTNEDMEYAYGFFDPKVKQNPDVADNSMQYFTERDHEVDIGSTLPKIQPFYRPLPHRDFESPTKKKVLSNEEAIKFTSSRKEKTAVYSGRRNYFLTRVPTLMECCTQVLIENIDAIESLGGVPYFILKPVLQRCTAQQLFFIEHCNPYLLEDTQELWQKHCQKDFKNCIRHEVETWRDMYWRIADERERKLKKLTANISASMSKSNPGRQVKLAYVDSFVKPPRDVARRQAKHGTVQPVNHTVKPTAPAPAPSTKTAHKPIANEAPTAPVVSKVPVVAAAPTLKKPRVAPLMAKTLKCMKQAFRR